MLAQKKQDTKLCAAYRRTQTLPRQIVLSARHTVSWYTCKCNLIYAQKNTIVSSVPFLFRLTNVQQHYVQILYEISSRLDSPSVKWCSFNQFSTHLQYQILPKICARFN